MEPWFWALVFLTVAFVLGFLEAFIPSQGILTVLAVSSLVAGIVSALMQDAIFGLLYFAVVLVLTPISIYFAIQLWPKTPIGRRMILSNPESDVESDEASPYLGLKELVGRRGTAKSKMLPAGAIVVDGRTYDAFSEGMPIQPDTPIVVVRVAGARITVRPLDSEAAAEEISPEDALSRSYETLDIEDPFADAPDTETAS